MSHHLVIGGSGVMGAAAIRAVRSQFGKDAVIVANWFGKEDPAFKIEGADHTIFGDISNPACIQEFRKFNNGKYEYLFYATALGEVGFPIKDATPEQIVQSNKLSFDPVIKLEEALKIGTIITYSTFYVMKHQLCSYGAMGYSKEALEKWTLHPGKSQRLCLRAGLFESQSSRGIKLLLRKNLKRAEEIHDPLLRSYFENVSSKDGVDKFIAGIIQEEKEKFGDSPTTPENLFQAHLELFKADPPSFINVCGSKIWVTDQPQLLTDYLH